MDERVDWLQGTIARRAVERDHNAGYRAPSEPDANEVPGREVEPFRHEVAERAGGPSNAGEDRDLRNTRAHSS